MADSSQPDSKTPSKFIYWLAGWISIIRHSIRVPRDWARAADMLQGDIKRIRL